MSAGRTRVALVTSVSTQTKLMLEVLSFSEAPLPVDSNPPAIYGETGFPLLQGPVVTPPKAVALKRMHSLVRTH